MQPRRFIGLIAVSIVVLALAPIAKPATAPAFHAPVAMPQSLNGSEPSLAIDENGNRYASWQAPGAFAVSSDGVNFTYRGQPDAMAVGDVTNAVDASGAVYNGQVCGDAFALHACIYRSTDGAKTWPQKSEPADTNPGAADRPWIDVYPHFSSSPAANSAPQATTVYLEYHTFSPEVLTYVTVSHDGGKTFGLPNIVESDTNAKAGSACNTIPGGVVVDDRNGTAYAVWISGNDVVENGVTGCNYTQISPYNKAWVSTSTDSGATWTSHLAWTGAWDATTLAGDNAGHLFPSITVDRDGQVHLLLPVRRNDETAHLFATCQTTGCDEVPQKTDLMMVTSPDQGGHWTQPFVFNPSGGSNFFPWIAGGSGGTVDAVYYRSPTMKPNDANSVWDIGFSQINGAVATLSGDTANYTTTPSVFNSLLEPGHVHKGGICTFGTFCAAVRNANRNLADSIAISLDPAGGANAIWTNDYPDPNKASINFACQSGGASALTGKPDLFGCYDKARPLKVLGTKKTPAPAKKAAVKNKSLRAQEYVEVTSGNHRARATVQTGALPGTGSDNPLGIAFDLIGAGTTLAVWNRRRSPVRG